MVEYVGRIIDGQQTICPHRRHVPIALGIAELLVCTNMCINMCIDACTDMCIDICKDTCVNMCMDMCMGMHRYKCMEMCMEMCMGGGHRWLGKPTAVSMTHFDDGSNYPPSRLPMDETLPLAMGRCLEAANGRINGMFGPPSASPNSSAAAGMCLYTGTPGDSQRAQASPD